jgi:hypothetical protein
MAAKLDKEMMKKQHFWLLLIPLFIGLLLAWLGLFFGVADATDERAGQNDQEKKKVDSAKAQAKKQLEEYDKRKEVLFGLRTERWKEMWNLQQGIYQWPEALGEDQIVKVKDLKFGADISDASFKDAYRDLGMKGYEDLAKESAPLQFAGDWRTALRTVPAWKRNPESEDIWLAAEDYWVQKELINALVGVNKDGGKFRRPTDFPEKDRKPEWKNEPKERTFIGRTWQLDLKLVDKPDGPTIEGFITNLTPRLQPFNASGALLFNVWLVDGDSDAKPFLFVVEGTSLEGGKREQIKLVPKLHTVREGRAIELAKVEQVFDVRTVPVKRVDHVVLGALSDRQRQAELQMTTFSSKAAEAPATATGAGTAEGTAGLGGSGSGPPPGMSIGGPGTGGLGAQQSSTDFTYNGLARRRYINITGQVRAMPVGLVVVADQGYVQDVLTALANCKLRFQTIQSTLARFRGSLSYLPQSMGGSSPGGAPPGVSAPRGEGSESSSDSRPPGVGPVPAGPPAGVGVIPGGPPRLGGPGFGQMMGPGMFGPGMFGGAPMSSSDDQTAGNLIEVTVFGIAALYEKFDTVAPKKDEAAAGPGTTSPTGAPAPMPTAPPGGMPPAAPATVPPGTAAPAPETATTPPAAPPKK